MQTITFKMPETLLEKLELYAERQERSKSFLIRKAIEAFVSEMEEDEADYREARQRLSQPQGQTIPLTEYAHANGLAIRTKRKSK